MAKDYGEMEQRVHRRPEGAGTGKDLAEWMAAIAAKAFANKNDTIDWLRRQGFAFNWASWLERIHANGGGRCMPTGRPCRSPKKAAPRREAKRKPKRQRRP